MAPLLTSIDQYQKLIKSLGTSSNRDKVDVFRHLCRSDLYFLLRYGLKRKDVERQWLFDRCKEVQASPNGHLDLWSREHYKSTLITYALSIQDILSSHGDNPDPKWKGTEVTIGIFSHTRPIAKAFLQQIKRDFEENELLKGLFPDILWENPRAQAPKWSDDSGIICKRKSNPKESTVEAWGVVDGQPTGKHFNILVYDDLVTQGSVTTPDMISKTTDALALSYNLGADGGYRRFIGTRYHYNDTYAEIIKRGTVEVRKFPATVDGKVEGKPVLLTREVLAQKRRDMGPYVFACQMMQDPKADAAQGFKREWLKFYKETHGVGNRYILVDPAGEKKKENDYTSYWVVELNVDGNYYVLDIVRDRQSLTERGKTLFQLHRKWFPIAGVGYEKYGMQSDIEHFEDLMEREHYRFEITPLGGSMGKNDRIRRLIPKFEYGKIWLPHHCFYTDYQGQRVDLVKVFIEDEYEPFPVGIHPDMLDSLARILDEDLNALFPKLKKTGSKRRKKRSWKTI